MSDRDREDAAPPEPPKRWGALIGITLLAAFAIGTLWYAATKNQARGLLEKREDAFQVKAETAAPVQGAAPAPKPTPAAAPADDARNRELAERLLLMQQQAEIARANKMMDAQLAAAKDEREKRAKRLAADVLVYSSGGKSSDAPANPADPTDLFASAMPTQPAAAPAAQADWIPAPDATTRGGVSAGYAGEPAITIYQGKMISAVLETRLESEKPGMVRAMVDEDVVSEDGSRVLVAKGSRLIGEYRAQVVKGDRRVLVIWQRLIRPDAVSIQLASPGTDELGVSGLTGDVDTRFMERFGAAILLSFVEGAAQRSQDGAVYIQDAESASNTALKDSINLPPRIIVDQGERVAVFVARDLDFRRTDG